MTAIVWVQSTNENENGVIAANIFFGLGLDEEDCGSAGDGRKKANDFCFGTGNGLPDAEIESGTENRSGTDEYTNENGNGNGVEGDDAL